jgi:hypothetical protein
MYLIYAQDLRPTAKLRSVIDFLLTRFGTEASAGCLLGPADSPLDASRV